MSKNQYRALIVVSLAIGLLSGVYDYIWPDSITDQVFDYIVEIEPEIEGAELVVAGVLAVLAIVMALAALIGLLLFKSWALRFTAVSAKYSMTYLWCCLARYWH